MLKFNIFDFFVITLHNKFVDDGVTIKMADVTILLLNKFDKSYNKLIINKLERIRSKF